MSSSKTSRQLDEEPLLPLYTSAPTSPVNRATAETAVKLLNRKGSTLQPLSTTRVVNPANVIPERKVPTKKDLEFDPCYPCKIFGTALLAFALFCIAIFAFGLIIWSGSALLKLSWIMLKAAFSAEAGLPGFGNTAETANAEATMSIAGAMNITIGQNVSNISADIP